MLTKENIQDICPLTPAQEGILFHALSGSDARHYFEQFAFLVEGPLNPAWLELAWREVAQRHTALRTVFVTDKADRPLQIVLRDWAPDFTCRIAPEASAPAAYLAARCAEDLARPFDLRRGKLLRIGVHQLRPDLHGIVLSFHHLVMDGWSFAIVLSEVFAAYGALARDRAHTLPAAQPFSAFVSWQERQSNDAAKRFWKDQLFKLTAPSLVVPALNGQPAGGGSDSRVATIIVDATRTAALEALASSVRATPAIAMQALWSVALGRLTGRTEVSFGTVVSGRPAGLPGAESIVGLFINTVVVRADAGPHATFVGLLQALQEQAFAREEHERLPIAEVRALAPAWPAFDHLLIYENYPLGASLQAELQSTLGLRLGEVREFAQNGFALTLQVNPVVVNGVRSLHVNLHYDAAMLPDGAVDRVRQAVDDALAQVLAAPRAPLAAAPVEAASTVAPIAETGYVAPRDALETSLAELWEQVLGVGPIGVHDDFFARGGHSLKAMQLFSQIRKRHGLALTLKDFLRYPTIAGLVAVARRKRPEEFLAIAPAATAASYPLSPAQRALWTLSQMGASTAYHIGGGFAIEGRIDVAALGAALQSIVQRHEALRTVFRSENGEPRQVVLAETAFRLTEAAATSDADEQAQLDAVATKPFDLEHGPLLRATLIRRSAERHVLAVAMHHLVGDGWSVGNLTRELGDAYAARCAGDRWDAPQPRLQYRDYAVWQKAQLDGDAMRQERDYWHKKLGGELPVLDLDTDAPRPAVKGYAGATHRLTLSGDRLARFKELCRAHDLTGFMGLTGLVQLLLHKYSGQRQLIIGTSLAGRPHADLAPLVGYFVNAVALRAAIDPGETVQAFFGRVKTTVVEAFDHQLYPFDQLVTELKVRRDPSRAPVYDVAISYQEAGRPLLALGEARVSELPARATASKYDLLFEFTESESAIDVAIDYDTALFGEARLKRLGQHLVALLDDLAKAPSRQIREVSCIGAEEHAKLLAMADGERLTLKPEERTFLDRFAAHVARTPDAPALFVGDRRYSMAELDAAATRVATYLVRSCGVQPGDMIGVMLERDARLVIGILAIHKAGGAYVPLDPTLPEARLGVMLDDCACRVLAAGATRQRAAAAGARAVIDFDVAAAADLPVAPLPAPDPARLAYVIYTSGSTGKPKGVLVEHGQLAAHLAAHERLFPASAFDVVLAGTPISFDMSLCDLFAPLALGRPLRLLDSTLGIRAALPLASRAMITVIPSVLRDLLDAPGADRLGVVNLGGEALPLPLARELAARGILARNSYGPTETVAYVTSWRLDPAAERVAIGGPIPGAEALVLGDGGALQPVGVTGEICIGGPAVARGYHRRPEATAERFVPHPWRPGQRLYRTGDLGRWLENGEIEFLGRRDHQVKLRGYRIELGEIEGCLAAHPQVQEVVVTARDTLVAYLVPRHGATLDPEELRRFSATSLPSYMVPSSFVVLAEMPLAASGKVDRAALPEPTAERGGAAASTPVEAAVARVWAAILGRSDIGRAENYFEAGGDSIKAIQIAARLRQDGYACEVRDILQRPTIATLASGLRPAPARAGALSAANSTAPAPLAPIQSWFFDVVGASRFHQGVMLRAEAPFDDAALDAAVTALVTHHEALRSTFVDRSQRLEPTSLASTIVRRVDLREADDYSFTAAVDALHASLTPEGGPLFGVIAAKRAKEDLLVFSAHHLIVDTISWGVIVEDFATAYADARAGRPIRLAPVADSYRAWSTFLSLATTKDEVATRELDHWRAAQLPPAQQPWPVARDVRGKARFSVDSAATAALLGEAHRAYGTAPNDLLLAALAQVLAGEGYGTRVRVDVEGHGRDDWDGRADVGRTVGWFTSLYPLQLDLTSDLGRQIKLVKESLRAVPHGGVGYGILTRGADVRLPPSPRATVLFNYLGQLDARASVPGFAIADVPGTLIDPKRPAPYPVTILCQVEGGTLSGLVEVDGLADATELAERLAQAMARAAAKIVAHCRGKGGTELTPHDIDDEDFDVDSLQAFVEGITGKAGEP